MRTHKDLEAWRASIELAEDIYGITRRFPKEELFGLVSQMRRAAVSVASNIAEGAARNGKKEFAQFLHIAMGSASELDTQIEISKRTQLHGQDDLQRVQDRVTRVKKLVYGLIRSLRA
ncbi:MAG: four helix bundle protein [Candidatus Muproteobacteria bacterium RBG_16_65_34]|uniref:Four helix bundle protein n=1 Tax=Candidatus Muproteobacteria bacterium RBG_16_65_34 TaxID=1817760 RepID=A0A1F6TPK2_9PROT|nr:MAG: four helix bundle protein [Candidatus Muproteobacteria bacterium RBG_16_65_34]